MDKYLQAVLYVAAIIFSHNKRIRTCLLFENNTYTCIHEYWMWSLEKVINFTK